MEKKMTQTANPVANLVRSSPAEADQALLDLFCKAAWEVDRKKWDALDIDAKVSALGIDSVAMLEVIGYIEEELNVHVADEKIARIETVRDLVGVISATL